MEPTYTIVPDFDVNNTEQRRQNWDMALGLNRIDNLFPSKYLLSQIPDSVNGKKNYVELEKDLQSYYSEQEQKRSVNEGERECDIVSARIASLLEVNGFSFRTVELAIIHKHLFEGVFSGKYADYVGKFRDYNLTKPEPVLGGDTVTYANYKSIEGNLKYDFDEERKVNYAKLDFEKQVAHLAKFTSDIWQTHAFVEGNTRTVAVFIEKYMRTLGWDVNNEPFKENSAYFRDALVLSNYANPQKKIAPRQKFIESFFAALLAGGELIPL